MSDTLPVSLGDLIREINQLTEKATDEYYFDEIHEKFPDLPERTLRDRLRTLERKGKVTRRKVSRKIAWKLVAPITVIQETHDSPALYHTIPVYGTVTKE